MKAPFLVDGVIPIIPTPFTSEDKIDFKSLERLLEFAVRAGVCGVCLPAYASEFYKLREAERHELVCHAVDFLSGRLPVVAQVNHVSAAYAAEVAGELENAGASAINVAVPRLMALPEGDLLRYFDRILQKISVPLIIQDYNPGGVTVSNDFVKRLHEQHPHFRYLKLEEPLMSSRVQAICSETQGDVGIIDGWGGVYMLELIDAGICGVMPGLAVSDILQKVWQLAKGGNKDAAYNLFQGVLPQITYSLQNMEFFHHAEKALLVDRGVLATDTVRDATMTVNKVDRNHIQFLNSKVMELVRSEASSLPVA